MSRRPTPDLAELRRLAEAATPGPWEADGLEVCQHWSLPEPWRAVVNAEITCGPYCYGGSARPIERDEDAAFIAAANPSVVLALLDAAAERDALAAKVERVRALHFGEYVEDEDRNRCFECGDDWPCPTVRALDEEPQP